MAGILLSTIAFAFSLLPFLSSCFSTEFHQMNIHFLFLPPFCPRSEQTSVMENRCPASSKRTSHSLRRKQMFIFLVRLPNAPLSLCFCLSSFSSKKDCRLPGFVFNFLSVPLLFIWFFLSIPLQSSFLAHCLFARLGWQTAGLWLVRTKKQKKHALCISVFLSLASLSLSTLFSSFLVLVSFRIMIARNVPPLSLLLPHTRINIEMQRSTPTLFCLPCGLRKKKDVTRKTFFFTHKKGERSRRFYQK